MDDKTPYYRLGPDAVLDAVESAGYRCDGHLLALNSYENRVYQVGIEDAAPLVAKFYRPGRWRDEALVEEHGFAAELAEAEVPVVAPLFDNGRSLHHHRAFRFALFPRRGGRAPELDKPGHLNRIGRFLGRLHAVGAARPFRHRATLSITERALAARDDLLELGFIPDELLEPWRSTVDHLLARLDHCLRRAGNPALIRLHGDCHAGNILWTDAGPHLVDLDDCINGPAIQDLWMLLSGDRRAMGVQMTGVLDGYGQFHDFDPRELHLLEPLRTLRMLGHSAWLARRWEDPAFPAAFPWFDTRRYWEDQILSLREQLALLDEPPLAL